MFFITPRQTFRCQHPQWCASSLQPKCSLPECFFHQVWQLVSFSSAVCKLRGKQLILHQLWNEQWISEVTYPDLNSSLVPPSSMDSPLLCHMWDAVLCQPPDTAKQSHISQKSSLSVVTKGHLAHSQTSDCLQIPSLSTYIFCHW